MAPRRSTRKVRRSNARPQLMKSVTAIYRAYLKGGYSSAEAAQYTESDLAGGYSSNHEERLAVQDAIRRQRRRA